MNRDIETTFLKMKFVEDFRLIATKTSRNGKSFCGQLPEKLSLSLLNGKSKWHTFRMKDVENFKLSFDSYQILVPR